MSAAPTIPAPPPAASDEADWARPFALRQLEMLGELAEIGLDVARAVERQASGQATGQPETPAPLFHGDLALAYSRVSRAVRLTLMLQSKLIEAIKAAEQADAQTRAAAEAEAHEAGALADPAYRAKARVEAIVERVAIRRHPGDPNAVTRRLREAAERLDDEDLYGDLLERPLSELVARLCKDLGLEPDWAELAEELWAVREVESGHAGWPLRVLPRKAGEVSAKLTEGAFHSDTG